MFILILDLPFHKGDVYFVERNVVPYSKQILFGGEDPCSPTYCNGAKVPGRSSVGSESRFHHVGSDGPELEHPGSSDTVQKLFQFIGSKICYLREAKYGFARLTIMASILKDGSIGEHFQSVG